MAVNINIPIENAVTDGSLNPVTSNAVFDGLALKANSADLATVATSGDYNDLDNLPTIPAAQVNADWNATSGVAEILNKPTIPSVTGFVPYTGATTNVDLGTHKLTTKDLVVNHPSGSGVAASITKGGSGEALTVVKSSGSGNAASITGGVTLIDELHLTTDLADTYIASAATWNAKQAALVSGTNIKTINGNSLLGSGDLVISGGGGAIAVGTTAVTSGTVGCVFFQGTGDVVQQSGSLFWDNTNSRLGVGATPATTVRLDVRAQGALSTDIAFRVRNSADTITPFAINGIGHVETRVNNSFHFKTSVIGSLNTVNKGNFGGYENGMVVGHGNTMNANVQMYIFGNNNSNSSNGNGIIAGYNNTAIGGNCFGSANNSKFGNVFGNNNRGEGSVFGNNNNISEASGHGGSATIIGNFLTLPNTPSINNTIFFGSRASAGAPHASIHHNNLGIGGVIPNLTNYDLNARGVFYTQNGTAPTTLVADTFGLYSADITAGNAAPHFRTENGSIVKLYQETTSITAATLNSNLGTILTDTDTFDGYTLKQVVKALRNLGILA